MQFKLSLIWRLWKTPLRTGSTFSSLPDTSYLVSDGQRLRRLVRSTSSSRVVKTTEADIPTLFGHETTNPSPRILNEPPDVTRHAVVSRFILVCAPSLPIVGVAAIMRWSDFYAGSRNRQIILVVVSFCHHVRARGSTLHCPSRQSRSANTSTTEHLTSRNSCTSVRTRDQLWRRRNPVSK